MSKWRAAYSQYYWFVHRYGHAQEACELAWIKDDERYAEGNYFKTRKEAGKHIKQILAQDPAEDNATWTANDSEAMQRKATPVFSGCFAFFPLALAEVARCSAGGNEQHNPGTPLHWDRSKSGDELDALTRHLLDTGKLDSDGILHDTKVAWRALANLQKVLEAQQ